MLGDSFFIRLATEALIFGGLALAVDLLLGIVGLLSLGQALYFGFGAYMAAVLLKDYQFGFWSVMLAVLLFSALLGWLTSFIALRSKGVYFALITFGLAQVAAKSVYNTRALGASDGMVGVPIVQIATPFGSLNTGDPATFFVIVFITIAIAEIFILTAAVLLLVIGTILGDSFFIRLATEALIFGGLALAVDLLLGISC